MITIRNSFRDNRGISILGILVIGFLILLVLGYFDISVRTVVESPTTQDNLEYVGGASKSLWDAYLREPARYLWNDIWLELFWRPFVSNMQKLRDGEPSEFDTASQNLMVEF